MASKMETMTQCQICLEDMADRTPRALTCLHTFCHDCLVKLPSTERHFCTSCQLDITNSQQRYSNLLRLQCLCRACNKWKNISTRNELCCPTCRMKTVLPPEGVKALTLNFLITSIKDAHQTYDGPHICQYCRNSSATHFCESFRYYLCEGCKGTHSSIISFKDHTVRALDTSFLCLSHALEAKYFCCLCVSRDCTTCVLSENHKWHSDAILDYNDWVVNKQNKIKEIKMAVTPPYIKSKAKLEQLECYQKNSCDILAKIEQTTTGMKEDIDNQAKSMKARLTETQERRKVSMDAMQKFCEDHDAISNSCDGIPNEKDVATIVEVETNLMQLQEAAWNLPVVRKDSWFTFTAEATPHLGDLEEDQRVIDEPVDSYAETLD